MFINIYNYKFEYVCEIIPETDDDGNIIEYYPQALYENNKSVQLHKYGKGPFCKFEIPDCWTGKEGVYCIYSGEQLVYVGECVDLRKRFNMGYGNISPRNCFKGGQSTNCKINNLILTEVKYGKIVKLYFTEIKRRFEVEKELIEKFHPPWNSQSGKNIKGNTDVSKVGKSAKIYEDKRIYNKALSVGNGGYKELMIYLNKIKKNTIQLTFSEIENIIKRHLPASAYKYREWWANGGHSQSKYWMKAGWKVKEVALGRYVVFLKE